MSTPTTTPVPATGPEAAAHVHYTDPRTAALSRAAHAAYPDDDRQWWALDQHEQHVWRTGARDMLRAAVTVGLLPRVVPSTGRALAAVPLDVRPGDGLPRLGTRGRGATFREAAALIAPDTYGWGGPDHYDAWKTAQATLLERAAAEDEADDGTATHRSPEALAAALARVEAWADQLDDTAQRKAGRLSATDPTADIIRGLLDGSRHGEAPH
ncbi:hypothetical protein ACPCSP_25795 [Streptomyces cinereoruber]|uniref:hypothetical protein n=1 Tax=Streptomyces cinereoruber TaxID=67260 RepID=UPI003C2CDE52